MEGPGENPGVARMDGARKGAEVWFPLTPPALATLSTLLNLRRVSYKAGKVAGKDLWGHRFPFLVGCLDS